MMNWFQDICSWKSPVTTVLVHILFLILVWYPELLLPTIFLYMFLIGSWNYRFRARTPPFMDAKLSQGEYIGDLDELEEEFNVVPANRAQEVIPGHPVSVMHNTTDYLSIHVQCLFSNLLDACRIILFVY